MRAQKKTWKEERTQYFGPTKGKRCDMYEKRVRKKNMNLRTVMTVNKKNL